MQSYVLEKMALEQSTAAFKVQVKDVSVRKHLDFTLRKDAVSLLIVEINLYCGGLPKYNCIQASENKI